MLSVYRFHSPLSTGGFFGTDVDQYGHVVVHKVPNRAMVLTILDSLFYSIANNTSHREIQKEYQILLRIQPPRGHLMPGWSTPVPLRGSTRM